MGFYSVTPDGLVLGHHIEFDRMFGYPPAEVLRSLHAPNIWLHPRERLAYVAEVREYGFLKDYPVRVKKQDGEPI